MGSEDTRMTSQEVPDKVIFKRHVQKMKGNAGKENNQS